MSSHDVAAEHGHAMSHGSLKSYIVGFVLSIILTLLAFYLVMDGSFSRPVALIGILVLCVAQLLVQLVFFMHMGTKPGGDRDNLSTFLFTVMIIGIIVGGSIWVLHNMNANMMHPMPM
ncbi:cytochrome o ubiquinol oxidase subunit IV [Bordetella genomosp. 1]|uniref:Cytochrome bo(3) ubiquinol oxidase subunit 4 n=1 Tax=Bordetella genomosp. 1 TaxID=1395607 RepID=A0A261RVN2_9BORD|nr:cytochrome o ubiquinol oxidase subunit IV [Bordetella genomosp. 1]OZI29146.1 cytochrome o ubiquinol oxidase subunit IV [Bordetella genomosp. 1]OZI65116.1 cytochrome o ubiquinol oxidase subunit IV [Bordetella genomosp. 1]